MLLVAFSAVVDNSASSSPRDAAARDPGVRLGCPETNPVDYRIFKGDYRKTL
jgi:hypothetical protein